MLPEVEKAMHEATLDYVEIDELMDGAGKCLSELTGQNGIESLDIRFTGKV